MKERKNIGKGINLNLIRTDKFKTNLISFYIIRPLNREEATQNALFPMVLRRGTERFDTNLKLERKLENMYGASLSVGVRKVGERHIERFTVESPEESYVEDKEYPIEVIKLLKELIYNPVTENGVFKKDYVEQEKENLKKIIEGKINDKGQYAIERCIEEMCKNEKYSTYEYGYIEDIEKINSSTLYKYYLDVLNTSYIEIFMVGNYKEDVAEELKKLFSVERKTIVPIQREKILNFVQTKNMIHEEMNVNQGKIAVGCRAGIPYEDPLYNGLILASDILGGGANSKLFRNIREKESLAYYIKSTVYKFKSIMVIDAGINFDDFQRVLELIRSELDSMKKGLFTEQDIDISKKSVSASIKSLVDSNYLISEFFLSQILAKDERNLEDILKDIDDIKKDEIVEACNRIYFDTIYFLTKNNYL